MEFQIVSKFTKRIAFAAALSGATLLVSPASASLVFDHTVVLSAQGFGAAPRDLTLQSANNNTTESGCVGVGAGGGITFGSCITNAQVFGSNGVQNVSGTGSMPNPRMDNAKYGVPTLASLGWMTAADIGLMFNATEPSGDSVNVADITLKFYNAAGVFITAIDGQQAFANSNPGNGVAGFAFVVDAPQQLYLNGIIFNQAGFGAYRIALEATILDATGGPESFLAFKRQAVAAVPEPATWGMMLLGFGVVGSALRRRKSQAAYAV